MTSGHQISLPGFSAEQIDSLTILIQHVLDEALDKRFGPLPPQQKESMTPKSAQPSEQKQAHQPLQQTIAENSAENITEDFTENVTKNVTENVIVNINGPVKTGLLSTISHQTVIQICREPSSCLSSALYLASLFAFFLAFGSPLGSPLGYIRHAEDMKTTGQR
ncbi:MAG: hypothetical protein ASARMPRED_004967 [Alectoria sarmentosa]|nr:MAG: hypothetical protein ASARMPRED_004967 [Alectoria sarmentosa]